MKTIKRIRGILKSLWFILTLDCRGSATLCSKRLDQDLSIVERVAVEAHLLICKKSRRLNRHLRQMQQMLTLSSYRELEPKLKITSKKRITQAINKELQRQNNSR